MNTQTIESAPASAEEMANIFAALKLLTTDTVEVDGQAYRVDNIASAITGLIEQRGGMSSIDTMIGGEESDMNVQVEDPRALNPFHETEDRLFIADILDSALLTSRQHHMVNLYYGINGEDAHTVTEIAALLNTSKPTVSKVLKAANAKLAKVAAAS